MAKYLIFKVIDENTMGELISTYESENPEETQRYLSHLALEPHAKHFALAEGQDEEVVRPAFVAGTPAVEAQPEKWTKEGEADVFEQPMIVNGEDQQPDPSWTYVPAVEAVAEVPGYWELQNDPALVAAKAAKAVEAQIVALYNQMNEEILAQMQFVFGTSNPDSANAYERTWNLMKADPTEWTLLDLKDDEGNLLDDEAKVVAYANSKLQAVLEYGKYRMQRIQQFREAKEALLNP